MFSAGLDAAHVSSARLNSMCLRQWEQRRGDVGRERTLSVNAVVPRFSRLSKECCVLDCLGVVYVCVIGRTGLERDQDKTKIHNNMFVVSMSVYLYFMTDLT